MISHNEGTFISFFKGRRIIPEAAEGSIMNFIPGLLSHKAANATMNQARQIRAGTCDTKDAHINAEKTKEA